MLPYLEAWTELSFFQIRFKGLSFNAGDKLNSHIQFLINAVICIVLELSDIHVSSLVPDNNIY